MPTSGARYAFDVKGHGIGRAQPIHKICSDFHTGHCPVPMQRRDQPAPSTAGYSSGSYATSTQLGDIRTERAGLGRDLCHRRHLVDLLPITEPVSLLGDAHLERPDGLGPRLPLNVNDTAD
ncbi:hypothetical protein DIJ64_05735 [Mycobacterium leprae]|uniref:Uncharacterized protein n=1 Tax=Mycobacterium leprae TaxID=1769 RepID=A0AAD0KUX8_MYCLR|nr:hypothetical protein [Mycobacterium leprae]AWV47755.1 hypothetical protein DIJ64_05735 [Mycobacterium leprae]OAR21190.1 hypothetical protein A8144_07395 [Mycobacterium leprae 3125609]OAX71104.1 hypothetical protein A3216_07985 [Mycobacterium leprae 7935681]